jgi:hypothetical protein
VLSNTYSLTLFFLLSFPDRIHAKPRVARTRAIRRVPLSRVRVPLIFACWPMERRVVSYSFICCSVVPLLYSILRSFFDGKTCGELFFFVLLFLYFIPSFVPYLIITLLYLIITCLSTKAAKVCTQSIKARCTSVLKRQTHSLFIKKLLHLLN